MDQICFNSWETLVHAVYVKFSTNWESLQGRLMKGFSSSVDHIVFVKILSTGYLFGDIVACK